VTTTSIYTHYDEVITPETGTDATSILSGATSVYLQRQPQSYSRLTSARKLTKSRAPQRATSAGRHTLLITQREFHAVSVFSKLISTVKSMPVDPAAYYLAVDALTHTGGASTSRFDDANCSWHVSSTL
jgi:hypothetical protein